MAVNLYPNTVTIAAGQSASGAVRVGGSNLTRISVPATWTAANIRIEGSDDGVTFSRLRDMAGALVAAVATAGDSNQVPPTLVHGWDWLRLVSVTVTDSTIAVNQVSAATLTLASEATTR